MSPRSGLTDPTGVVYVLREHLHGRDVVPTPTTNAERPDTDQFYADGLYDRYPARKHAYEQRRARERHKVAAVQAWALAALDAWDTGGMLPATDRDALVVVLGMLRDAESRGMTRPEICRASGRDGGKISGALTDLHAAGIIFPLLGVRR